MEDLINRLILIDNNALDKIKQIKEKENNIENFISEKLETEKNKIDAIYIYKRKIIQEKYDKMFEENRLKLDEQKRQSIDKIQIDFNRHKSDILEKLLKNIVN